MFSVCACQCVCLSDGRTGRTGRTKNWQNGQNWQNRQDLVELAWLAELVELARMPTSRNKKQVLHFPVFCYTDKEQDNRPHVRYFTALLQLWHTFSWKKKKPTWRIVVFFVFQKASRQPLQWQQHPSNYALFLFCAIEYFHCNTHSLNVTRDHFDRPKVQNTDPSDYKIRTSWHTWTHPLPEKKIEQPTERGEGQNSTTHHGEGETRQQSKGGGGERSTTQQEEKATPLKRESSTTSKKDGNVRPLKAAPDHKDRGWTQHHSKKERGRTTTVLKCYFTLFRFFGGREKAAPLQEGRSEIRQTSPRRRLPSPNVKDNDKAKAQRPKHQDTQCKQQ